MIKLRNKSFKLADKFPYTVDSFILVDTNVCFILRITYMYNVYTVTWLFCLQLCQSLYTSFLKNYILLKIYKFMDYLFQ